MLQAALCIDPPQPWWGGPCANEDHTWDVGAKSNGSGKCILDREGFGTPLVPENRWGRCSGLVCLCVRDLCGGAVSACLFELASRPCAVVEKVAGDVWVVDIGRRCGNCNPQRKKGRSSPDIPQAWRMRCRKTA